MILDGPIILVRRKQIPVLIEDREAHAVRVGLQDLVPAPQHVPVHIVVNVVRSVQCKTLGLHDSLITGRNGTGVYCFWIRPCTDVNA